MRIKVLLFDSSHLEDVLGFQRSYLSILHTAIKNQVDINVVFISVVNTNGEYGKFLKAADALHEMLKEQLNAVHCDVWITTSINGDAMVFTTINTDAVITMTNGYELYAPDIGLQLRQAKQEQIKRELGCKMYEQAENEKDAYNGKGHFDYDQSTSTATNPKKGLPTKKSPEIIAMENILERKEYLNEEE